MAIEIVDLPIKDGDFPWQTVGLSEGNLTMPSQRGSARRPSPSQVAAGSFRLSFSKEPAPELGAEDSSTHGERQRSPLETVCTCVDSKSYRKRIGQVLLLGW